MPIFIVFLSVKIISVTQFNDYNRDSVGDLTLLMDTGVGINNNQGIDPQIMLRTSIDGAKTWSKELKQQLGKQGNYETEVVWNRVASGRSLIMEFKISDPVKRAIIDAYLDTTGGQN